MALEIVRRKRTFGYDESKTEKYVIVADRGPKVTSKALYEQIAHVSGVNEGAVKNTIWGLVTSLRTFIQQGHPVYVEGLGTFTPALNSASSTVEKEINSESVKKIRVNFRPDESLKQMLDTMELHFNVADSTHDTETPSEPEEDEPVVQ